MNTLGLRAPGGAEAFLIGPVSSNISNILSTNINSPVTDTNTVSKHTANIDVVLSAHVINTTSVNID